jgi:hypothetical protein
MSLILVVHYEHFDARLSTDFMDEGDGHSVGQEVSLLLWSQECSLPYSQESATGLYPKRSFL